MRPDDEAAVSAQAWLEYADADIEVATLIGSSPHLTHMACYHAQQAAEKALKAYLAWSGDEEIPRTHNLELLASLVVLRGGPVSAPEAVKFLNVFSVSVRYPETERPAPEEAGRAREFARELLAFVRSALQEASSAGANGADSPAA